jgi:aspartyl protease family protein
VRLLWTLLSILSLALFVSIARRYAGAGRIDFSSLAVTSALAVFLGAVALALLRERLSQAVERTLTWTAVAFLLVLGYAYRSDLHAAAKRGLAEFLPGHAAARSPVVEIERGAGGNFPVAAHINGARIAMMLDTGASSVVLTQDAARAAGLPIEVLSYTVRIDTANGRARAAPVTLDSIAIGGIVERAVPALIAQPGHLRTNLLGMSFLNRMERWEVSDDKLVLRGYP